MMSHNILSLHVENTESTPEDGDSLMECLANSSISSLQNLTIVNEKSWFANQREESIAPLIAFLQRQNQLGVLDMRDCGLSNQH